MPYNRAHVRDFLNAGEIALFESSIGPALKQLAAAELQRRIVRARNLRDKYRDLGRRQALKTRARTGSKKGPGGNANERTAKKAVALDEALKRFEAQAKATRVRDAAAGRARTTAKKATTTGTGAAGKKTAGKTPSGKASSGKATSAKKAAGKKAAGSRAAPRSSQRVEPAAVVLRRALEKKQAALDARAGPVLPHGDKGAAAASGGVGPTPPDVRAAAVVSRQNAANLKPIQGHTSTQVRQAQAKRDQRD